MVLLKISASQKCTFEFVQQTQSIWKSKWEIQKISYKLENKKSKLYKKLS